LRLSTALLCFLSLTASAQADVFIGIAAPLSGPNAAFGNEIRIGVNAAVAAANAAGGINGEPLAVVEGDDACDSRRAGDVARELIKKDVRLVVGHFCSSASMAAAPVYAEASVMMITPSATFPDLTEKGLWNVFRLTGRDDAQADFAAARIKTVGDGAEVVMLTDDQGETATLAKRFRVALPNAKSISVKAGDVRLPNDTGLITASAAYLALQATDAAEAAKALKQLNAGVVIYGPDILQTETFATRAGQAANGTRITFLKDVSAIADGRRANTVSSKEGAALPAYAAVETFVAAAKASNVNDGRAMAQWLNAGTAIDTVIGAIKFDAKGDLQEQPYQWYKWQGGELQPDLTTN
jgi:branched-chain amino acid transport system substrate-binding protein